MLRKRRGVTVTSQSVLGLTAGILKDTPGLSFMRKDRG